ncbi:hypothetical protein HK44_008590 [Pseudomonas fluorescens HK44]|uniref:Uncharacterized protein n=1 Tax=Pseudomonas fluorescens HK44 TaxID=1042209 RepID=A0A010RMC4_PSEFL|nr:hypothetical protein HK44_008590 [Pseudomonas fluorescens HK44]
MKERLSSLAVVTLMALGGISLLFVIKYCIEYFIGSIAESWIDLALVLSAYVLFFLLEPIRKSVSKKWSKGARRKRHGGGV